MHEWKEPEAPDEFTVVIRCTRCDAQHILSGLAASTTFGQLSILIDNAKRMLERAYPCRRQEPSRDIVDRFLESL